MKKVLITGASRGIGRAAALMFHENGYDVIANYNKTEITDLEKIGIRSVKADVSDFEQVRHMFDKIGGVDILLNNAGIAMQKMLCDTTPQDWDKIFGTNMTGMYNTVKCAMDYMVNQKYGKIINISSMWGTVGASCEVAYSATKSGIHGLTRALAKELAPSNIQVNAIACGVIDTEMNGRLNEEERQDLMDEIPSGRFAAPEEVAELALKLTDTPAYMTGQIIGIDGGFI